MFIIQSGHERDDDNNRTNYDISGEHFKQTDAPVRLTDIN